MTSRPNSNPADEPSAPSNPDQWTVLAFTVGTDRYCIPLEAVDRVVGVTDTDPLESAPDPWHAGTVTVDGDSVRVVDLPRVFSPGGADRVDDPALVVVTPEAVSSASPAESADDGSHGETAGQRYGWLVDHVGGTETIDPVDVQPVRTSARLIRGRVDLESGSATVLDERVMHSRQ